MRTALTVLCMILLTQLTACSDTDDRPPEVKASGEGRIFNTQREALEQAKSVADFADQRARRFDQQSQEPATGKD